MPWTALLVVLAASAQAHEEKYGTGRYFYKHCEASLDQSNSEELFRQGECVGMFQAMGNYSEQLSPPFRFYSPGTTTGAQFARAAMTDMDEHSDEMDSSLLKIAATAFRNEWPCR